MRIRRIVYWLESILILLMTYIGTADTQVEADSVKAFGDQPIKVLFIGNSYTYVNDLPWWIQQLAASAKETRSLETEMVVFGGASLKSHWNSGKALRQIRAKRWDYVVLQEQSTLPITNPQEMYKYARLFNTEIKQVHAQTLFYLTWARQNRPETQQILTNAYITIARELKAKVAPVGIAWQKIRAANPNLHLYYSDQSHPSPIGSYVAACVFYTILYEKNPLGLSRDLYSSRFNTPEEGHNIKLELLSKTDAETIQSVVWEVGRVAIP